MTTTVGGGVLAPRGCDQNAARLNDDSLPSQVYIPFTLRFDVC